MPSEHYKWQQAWTLDRQACTAHHITTDLTVTFLALPLSEADKQLYQEVRALGECWTPDRRHWGIITTSEDLERVTQLLLPKHGKHNTAKRLARLAREAGELWSLMKMTEH